MTLTELKYIVAVAREKHFGKAAEACFVSQPTLSVAIKKLEEELEVKLFERSANEVTVTPLGEEIVRQAQSACWSRRPTSRRLPSAARTRWPGRCAGHDLHHRALPAARPGAPGDRPHAADAADAAGELHRQAAGDAAHRRDRLRHPGRALPGYRPGHGAAVRRALHGGRAQQPSAGRPQKSVTAEQLKKETMLLLGNGPLFSRPCAGGVPRVRALFQQRRGHPQEL
jgi:LysR family hydrogen peroxide-inducible transcriptional activator